MIRTLHYNDQSVQFNFIEEAGCWQANTVIDNLTVEIEIYLHIYKHKEIDWEHLGLFFKFVSTKGFLSKLISDSNNLVNELGKAFYREGINEIADYKMKFNNSIFYNGKTDGTFIEDGFSFSLVYNYFTERNNRIYGDEYGLYLVDIENTAIVGVRRHQC